MTVTPPQLLLVSRSIVNKNISPGEKRGLVRLLALRAVRLVQFSISETAHQEIRSHTTLALALDLPFHTTTHYSSNGSQSSSYYTSGRFTEISIHGTETREEIQPIQRRRSITTGNRGEECDDA